MDNFASNLSSDSFFLTLLNVLSQANKPAASYAMGASLYSQDWDTFCQSWNEGLYWLAQISPEIQVSTQGIESLIEAYTIPLSVASDGTLSIVV